MSIFYYKHLCFGNITNVLKLLPWNVRESEMPAMHTWYAEAMEPSKPVYISNPTLDSALSWIVISNPNCTTFYTQLVSDSYFHYPSLAAESRLSTQPRVICSTKTKQWHTD